MIIALIAYLALLALAVTIVFPALVLAARADQRMVACDPDKPESVASQLEAAARPAA
jgi:hypothetical protein